MSSAGTRWRRRSVVGALAATAMVLASCGDDDGGSAADVTEAQPPAGSEASAVAGAAPTVANGTDGTDAPTPATEPTGDGAVAAGADIPERIISLSPTHTEMMFAIGAEDLLVAVDDQSDHPAEALDLPHDLSGFEPNVESIVGYEPDLVLMGGDFTGLGEQLDALGIAWWDGPAALTLDDTYAQIEALGELTGRTSEAAEVVASMRTDIDEILAGTPRLDPPLEAYHEIDPSLYSADSTTFIGALYGMVGLRNVADRAEGDSGGYPQLNAEFIVSADPDLIFLADTGCCGENAETVAVRPGWDVITAVRDGGVVEMDDDIASRWGPRVVDYLRAVSDAVQAAAQPA